MAKKISSSGISNGGRITASQLKQVTDALSSAEAYSVQITGSLSVTGSSEIQGSLTAVSMSGEGSGVTGVVSSSYSVTASHALTSISSSYAVSSSHALTSISSSYAVSSSVTVVTEISSSFSTSASRADSAASVEFIDITGKPTLVSGSSQIDLGSATGKATLATTADTASYIAAGNIDGTVANATTAATANAVAFINITGKPTLVSGSSQIDLASASGIAANATNAVTASYIDSVNINQPFSSITASGDIDANNINLVGEISSSTLDVASNGYIGGDLQVSGSITGSALNLYGVDYKPWMLLGSAWFNAGVNISGDKIGPDWKNNTTAAPWPQSAYPFQVYWNPDLVDISGQGKVEMSVRVLSNQDNSNGFNFGLFDGTDGFLSASLSSPWTQRTDTTLGWVTATISGSDFSGKAFTNTSTDRILEFQAYSGDVSNYYGIYAIQIYAKKI